MGMWMGLFIAVLSVVTLRPLLLRTNRLPLFMIYLISLSKYALFSVNPAPGQNFLT